MLYLLNWYLRILTEQFLAINSNAYNFVGVSSDMLPIIGNILRC